jgi:pyruvate/2-oxoglutarate dehydrogenase complex dihydrolipoamide acyltransferase (E2) component
MWTFIRVPVLPLDAFDGFDFVRVDKYLVPEKSIVERGQAIASAHTTWATFEIISDYRGKVLKQILERGMQITYGQPVATLELKESIDLRPVEKGRIVSVVQRPAAEQAKLDILRGIRDRVGSAECEGWDVWLQENSASIGSHLGAYFLQRLQRAGFENAQSVLAIFGVEVS